MSEINKGYYAIIPGNIRYDNEIPSNAKLFYAEITALCNEKGYCWANNEYFTKLYDTSERTIRRWLNILRKKGYITVEYEYRAGTKEILKRYIKLAGGSSESAGDENSSEGTDKNVHTCGQNCPIGGDKNVRENNINNNNIIYKDILSCKDNGAVDKPVDNSKNAVKKGSNTKNSEIILKVIDYLNKKCNVKYKPTTTKTQISINARLNEGFVLEDFYKVIDIKSAEWMNDPKMCKYLRPETLFGSKFESYLNQKRLPVKQNQVMKPTNKFHNFIRNEDFSGDDLESIARRRFAEKIKSMGIEGDELKEEQSNE